MSLVRRAVEGITRTSASAVKPPIGDRYNTTGLMVGGQARTLANLNLLQASGWLFACVDRIAASVSAIQWNLYAKATDPTTPPEQIFEHPLLNIWARPNKFYTNQEFVEVSVQHFELAGEIWWVVLRNALGEPVELWPIRPDRIKPVPSRDEYIAGYLYQVGAEAVPLTVDDVIFIRRPSPIDTYRGIGVVGSILAVVATEQEAAQWTANFFRNNAEPGGIIQFDEDIDDASFDRIVQRWRMQHQGTGNAHRVAVIERGKWVDRAYTNRDIQLEQLRRLDRDLILGAFGMPASALGITEDVNRANAEAGQFALSQNIVLPRLRRIQGEINQTLCPMFGEGLEFNFVDPTPEYRELNITEATEGYKAGILTRDEARERLGEPPASEGGDQFFSAPVPLAPGAGMLALMAPKGVHKDDPLLSVDQENEESRIRRGWTRRLATEAEAVVSYLAEFKGQPNGSSVLVGSVLVSAHSYAWARQKLELTDLLGMDFDWWSRYGDEVIAELVAAYSIVLTDADPAMGPGEVQRRASLYAANRGARLLRLDGDLNIAEATRRRVNDIVGQALERGDGLQAIQKQLREDFMFSRERATMVARTESATALGQGSKEVAFAQGRDQKRWVTQGLGSNVDQPCLDNEAQGWIGINDLFQSGVDTIPQHINCLIGASRVSAQDIAGVSKRWYQGEVIILRTAMGNQLTCTPNHPILTNRGWIQAGLLKPSDYVISSQSRKWMDTRNIDDQNIPSRIEQIADTLLQSGRMVAVPVPLTSEDFHGDGIGSKVAIIGANSLLRDIGNAPPVHSVLNDIFQGGSVRPVLLHGKRMAQLDFQTTFTATHSIMGRHDLANPLGAVHARPFQSFSSTLVTEDDSRFTQRPGDGDAAYSIPSSEDIYRIAGLVLPDKVIEIRREPFSGHVYNLQTEDGFYVAESIITHNCRCVVRYRTAVLHEEAFRCPQCNKLLTKTAHQGESYWCSRCKLQRIASIAV